MCFLLRFFLSGYDMFNSCSANKRIYGIDFHLRLFNFVV